MIRKMSRPVLLLLVLLMSLSMVACSSTTPASTAPTTAAATTAGTTKAGETTAATTAAQAREPITITGAIFMEPIESSTIKTDPVSKYIEEKFGITLDIVNNCIGSSWTDQAPALLAANDLPDVFLTIQSGSNGVAGFIKQLVDADAVYPLDDLIAQNCPNISSNPYMQASVEYNRTFYSPDGKVYTFPYMVGVGENPRGPVVTNAIRWDTYKAAGYPEIKDMSQFADVLKLMQDNAPAGVDGKKAYALSGWFADSQGWGDWPLIYGAQMYAYNANKVAFQYVGKDSLEKTSGLVDINSPFWTTVAFYNKANRLGILDPDAFTMKWDDWNKKVEDGLVLYCPAGWIPTQKNAIIEKNIAPDAGFVSLPPLDSYGDNFLYKSWAYGAEGYCIAKTCEYPERVAELFDWMCSEEGAFILQNGPEGLAWDMVDGKPVAHDDYIVLPEFDTGAYKAYGANLYHHFNGYTYTTFLPTLGTTANLRLSDAAVEKSLTSYQKDALTHYGATTFGDASYFGKVKNNTYAYPLANSFGALPEDLQTANNNIGNFLYKAQFQAIQAKTDEEFQAAFQSVVDYYNGNQGPEILKWYLDNEAAVKAKLDPICKPVMAELAK